MTVRIISGDGIGVRALLTAAEKVFELTEERNIALGVIEGEAIGEDFPVAVVTGQTVGKGPRLGVTVERNPRIVDLGEAGEPPVERGTSDG